MRTILYVHGYKSNKNSNTVNNLRKLYPEDKIYAEDFDLMDIEGTLQKITQYIKQYNADYLIGSSLGGFYVLLYNEIDINKIVINPCMMPATELPKIDHDLTFDGVAYFEDYEKQITGDCEESRRKLVYGIFGAEDELFHYGLHFLTSFLNKEKANIIYITGRHRLTIDELQNGIAKAFDYYERPLP